MAAQDTDNWQWLEKQEAPECLDRVDGQNERTNRYFDGVPKAKELENRLIDLAKEDVQCPQFFMVQHVYRLRKSDQNKEGVLEVAEKRPDGTLDEWRQVIDIDELDRTEGKSYELKLFDMASSVVGGRDEGSWRLLLLLSDEGGDTIVLREVDVERGVVLEDDFRTDKDGRITVAWMDQDHILINHALNQGPVTRAGWPACAYVWKRGTPLEEAELVFQAEPTDTLCIVQSFKAYDGQRRGLILRAIDFANSTAHLVAPGHSVRELKFPAKLMMEVKYSTTSQDIIGSLDENATIAGVEAPVGTVVAYSLLPDVPESERLSVVYKPLPGESNSLRLQNGVMGSRSRVHLTLSRRKGETRLTLERSGANSDCTILQSSGLRDPTRTWLEDGEGGSHELHKQPSLFPPEDYVVEQSTAHSKDGTEVDYFVLRAQSDAGRGTVPTMMTGYTLMGMGPAWTTEYGDPQDPEMAAVLRSYSPFHNVKAEIEYPSFLITVSTRDDRVGAGHARKLAAGFQEVASPHCFLPEDRQGGHQVSDSFKNAALMGKRVAFFVEHLQKLQDEA